MDGDVLRVRPVGEATGTMAGCPTCGASIDQCVCYERAAFCMECGEVFEFALEERGMDESFINDK